jgi:hypothetical protein
MIRADDLARELAGQLRRDAPPQLVAEPRRCRSRWGSG